MSTVSPLHREEGPRSWAAAEIRAWLARERMSVARLGRVTGKGQMYWQRRLGSELVPLDVEDLGLVADALHIDLGEIYRGMANGPRPRLSEDEGQSVRARRYSKPQPSDLYPAALAEVVDLGEHRQRRTA